MKNDCYRSLSRTKNTLSGGSVHTYNITVKQTGLEVTVDSNMSWGTSTSGSGSVDSIYKIDLSNGSVTISDDECYILTGTGSDGVGVTINGSPTVTLNNVTLNKAGIDITGDSPTLIIQGENTLGVNIIMKSETDNVTIRGEETDNNKNILNIDGCINGDNGTSNEITIEGINLQV